MSRNRKQFALSINNNIAEYIKLNYPKSFNSYNDFLRSVIPIINKNNKQIILDHKLILEYESLEKTRNNFTFNINSEYNEEIERVASMNLRSSTQQATYYVYFIYSQLKKKKNFYELISNNIINVIE